MSRRYDLEIIPPRRGEVTAHEDKVPAWAPTPSPDLDGFLSSAVTRWRASRRTKTLKALTETMVAAREFFDAETRAIESRTKSREAAYRFAELPDLSEREASRRRAEHTEQMRELQHRHEMAELLRATERTQAETTLLAAEQAAAVQRERGYELLAKKQSRDVLDLDLALAERETVLRQHLAEMRQALGRYGTSPSIAADAIEEALYQARAQLHANGLDTKNLDDVIELRRSRR